MSSGGVIFAEVAEHPPSSKLHKYDCFYIVEFSPPLFICIPKTSLLIRHKQGKKSRWTVPVVSALTGGDERPWEANTLFCCNSGFVTGGWSVWLRYVPPFSERRNCSIMLFSLLALLVVTLACCTGFFFLCLFVYRKRGKVSLPDFNKASVTSAALEKLRFSATKGSRGVCPRPGGQESPAERCCTMQRSPCFLPRYAPYGRLQYWANTPVIHIYFILDQIIQSHT